MNRRALPGLLLILMGTFACAAAEPWHIRAVQLDLARQKETVPFLKAYVDRIAEVGYNTLVLYLEGRVKTASVPFLEDEASYTPAEMREVVSHAVARGIDVVPVVSLLGHAELFTRHGEMKPLAEGRALANVGATFCLSQPETRAFLGKYVAEMCEIFPSRNFHVGFDEAWDMGTCERCAPLRRERGMGPLFTEFVRWAHEVCAKHGRRMWMWDDLYEFFPEELKDCPRDVLLCHWKYDAISPWGIRARFADQMRRDWMATYAQHGLECLAACNTTIENIRTFTDYAKRHPNCRGGLLTQWEMGRINHGSRFPLVLGTGVYWTKAFDSPSFDFADAGARLAFPSLGAVELSAAKCLLAEQSRKNIIRPKDVPDKGNLRGQMRGVGPWADDLALAVLRRSRLSPDGGAVASDPLAERALLDDLVGTVAFSRFNDLFREVEPMLRSPERTVDGIRSAKAKLAAAEPELRRVCARRAEQCRIWRGVGQSPDFPSADWGADYVKTLLATPETPAEADEWWLVVDMNLPDWYSNLSLSVYGKFADVWRPLASGAWKPGIGDTCCFQVVIPFRSALAPTELRLSSENGLGICGVNYIACVSCAGRLVPSSVVSSSGYVKDVENILVDNWYPVVFGHPDRFHNAFHREGKRRFVGTLDVSLVRQDNAVPVNAL